MVMFWILPTGTSCGPIICIVCEKAWRLIESGMSHIFGRGMADA